MADHKNAEHFDGDQRKMLGKLMSQFEDIMKGAVGDYKNMEVAFDRVKTTSHIMRSRTESWWYKFH